MRPQEATLKLPMSINSSVRNGPAMIRRIPETSHHSVMLNDRVNLSNGNHARDH